MDCERDALDGEDYCRFHLPPHLRKQISELSEVVKYMESQFRYIANVTNQESISVAANYTLAKYESLIRFL